MPWICEFEEYPRDPVSMRTEMILRQRAQEFWEQRRTWFIEDGPVRDRRIFWSETKVGTGEDMRRVPCARQGDTWEHLRYLIECELSMHGQDAKRNPWTHDSTKRSSSAVEGFEVLDGEVLRDGKWKISDTRKLECSEVVPPGSHVFVKIVSKPRNYPTFIPGRFRIGVFKAWERAKETEFARNHMDVVLAFENTEHVTKHQVDLAKEAVVQLDKMYREEVCRAMELPSYSVLHKTSKDSKWPHFCDLVTDPVTGRTLVPPSYVCTSCGGIGDHLPEDCPDAHSATATAAPPPEARAEEAEPVPAEVPAALDPDLADDLFSPMSAPPSWL